MKGVDFGCVGFHESVLSSVEVTNTSALVQEIGFVNTPNVCVVCALNVYICTMHMARILVNCTNNAVLWILLWQLGNVGLCYTKQFGGWKY